MATVVALLASAVGLAVGWEIGGRAGRRRQEDIDRTEIDGLRANVNYYRDKLHALRGRLMDALDPGE